MQRGTIRVGEGREGGVKARRSNNTSKRATILGNIQEKCVFRVKKVF